jgi:hypothetical protein
MKPRLSSIPLAAAAIALLTTAAHANPPAVNLPACSFSDLTGVSVDACAGFVAGNLLKGNTGDTVSPEIAGILAGLGMANASSATYIEKLPNLGGSTTVNFDTALSGVTIVGLHLGHSLPGTPGDSNATALYRFDAGANLDLFGIDPKFNSSSGVALFTTSPVPEPETYALLLAGLGALGFLARRRRS